MRSLPSCFLFLVSFLFLIYSSTINVHSKVLCLDNEKHALLDFKLSFVHDSHGYLSNWSIDNVDCCANWFGVYCDPDTGHVTGLSLGGMTSNKLRPSLLKLQHLTFLFLIDNQFTMGIPKLIGSLSELTSLVIDSGFFGEIPPQLGNLSKLQSLYLSGSEFFGEIPPELGNLSELQSLYLSDSGFSGEIPLELGNLSKLQTLDLSNSRFSGEIPPQLGNLSKLQSLDLSHCGFSGEIPPQLGNLSKLQTLDLSYSDGLYTDSLHWLSCLSSLVSLNLSNVNLTHAVDWAPAVQMLPSLSDFDCTNCSLPPPILSSPSHVNFSTSLRRLYISNNNLNNLPLELILMFPSLTLLDANSNQIKASLPEVLRYLPTTLTELDLSSNLLNGVIFDTDLSKFPMLEGLLLSNNVFLTFNFSKSWVPPFQLSYLQLSSCKVSSFPNWILTQKKLNFVDISNSMISGEIPDVFWDFSTRLFILNLSHNQVSGMIPNSNSSLSSLYSMEIDLSYNAFHGPIPLFLFRTNILCLSTNKFSSFPLNDAPFGFLFNVNPWIIHLSDNNLSGTLPNWLFQCDELNLLNLENNKLSGNLSGAIGSLVNLNALHLSNNMFSGHLPSSMKNCTDLSFLELANNNFSGDVPSWLGESLSNLSVLTLRSNNFFRDLPSSLCYLQNLQILDLSDNKLSGTIPSCLHNFSCMASKKGLSFNFDDFIYLFDVSNIESESVMWKGKLVELYSESLQQRNVINLSDNLLRGEIPIGVTTLKELRSLDLSRNNLTGSIPDKIGQLTSLEVLKLSSNRLCGEIPQSLGDLTFLGTLNLSNNNLSGRIPTGTQLQSFDPFSYAGNPKLCGKPLPTKCLGDEDDGKKQPLPSQDAQDEDDESFDIQAFLAALGMGFAVGLLGVLGVLHFNRQCRLAFFQLVNNITDKIFVTTSLIKAKRAATM